MPPAKPGGLDIASYRAIVEFVAGANALPPPSAQAVAMSPEELAYQDGLRASNAVTKNFDREYQQAMQSRSKLINGVSPVTDSFLKLPPDEDWPMWRRTLDTLGYSPLTSINRENVTKLTLAWSLSLAPGTGGIAPLVHDGVMFLNASGKIMALDATTGDTIWQKVVSTDSTSSLVPLTQPRTIALYGDALYVPTLDGRVLAVDVRTGQTLWDTQIFGVGDKLQLTSGPLVVRGKVFQGVAGCQGTFYPGGCFIVALDAKTGKKIWTFHTIARADQPGGDSWNGAPVDQRFGASVWIPGSYDPGTNLLYFGTGQTYKTSTLLLHNAQPGTSSDALYTDTTLALNPDTGALVWHYQHLRADVWDLDWAFERSLITAGGRRAVLTGGKAAIFDVLDAQTGEYISSVDSGVQTLVSAIDLKTGQKTINPAAMIGPNKSAFVCPSTIGGRNWPSTAYDNQRGVLYVPIFESCMQLSMDFTGMTFEKRPDSNGLFGRTVAIDLNTGKILWTDRRRSPPSSALLATAGGLLFGSAQDRWFRALDSSTGKVLWQTRLADTSSGFPITFATGGKQYVAIVSGGHTPWDSILSTVTPENGDPGAARTIWVFALGNS